MNIDLDHFLGRLQNAPLDQRLDQIEPGVWARIDAARREAPQSGTWGWRAALAAVMLCFGALAGGVAAAQAQESSPFAIQSSLAPSTLLEGSR